MKTYRIIIPNWEDREEAYAMNFQLHNGYVCDLDLEHATDAVSSVFAENNKEDLKFKLLEVDNIAHGEFKRYDTHSAFIRHFPSMRHQFIDDDIHEIATNYTNNYQSQEFYFRFEDKSEICLKCHHAVGGSEYTATIIDSDDKQRVLYLSHYHPMITTIDKYKIDLNASHHFANTEIGKELLNKFNGNILDYSSKGKALACCKKQMAIFLAAKGWADEIDEIFEQSIEFNVVKVN